MGGFVHGGAIAALLDDAMSGTAMGFTKKRYGDSSNVYL